MTPASEEQLINGLLNVAWFAATHPHLMPLPDAARAVEPTATLSLWLVRHAARNAGRFVIASSGERVLIGVTSSGDMLAWHA